MNYWELKRTVANDATQEALTDFLLSLKLINRRESTIVQYRDFLSLFFLPYEHSYAELSSQTILDWFTEQNLHLKEASVVQKLSILSSFFTFCVEEAYIEKSPMRSRWNPRLPQPIPKFLEKEDVAKTRVQVEKQSARNQAMVELMYSSGCRVGELHLLDLSDVNFENRSAHVHGKGGKIRTIHFSERCNVLLERYLEERKKGSIALFVTSTGKRLSIRGIQKIVRSLGESAGLSSVLHPHRFRHTFATELLAKGADIAFISGELGHSDIATTQIYARLPTREVISLYRRYMG